MSSTSILQTRITADNFRIVHDVSLEDLSCCSDEDDDEASSLSSSHPVGTVSTGDISTTHSSPAGACDNFGKPPRPPVNYLENSFSINIKNATNLLYRTGPVPMKLTEQNPTLTALRIEDVEKLERGLPVDFSEEKKRLSQTNGNNTTTTINITSPEEVVVFEREIRRQKRELSESNYAEEMAPKVMVESSRSDEADENVFMNEEDTNRKSFSSSPETPTRTPTSVHHTPTKRHQNSVKRKRRPRKLPEIPVNTPTKNGTRVPLTAVVNNKSLSEELRTADPRLHLNGVVPSPFASKDSHQRCPHPASVINWNDLGSPDQVDPVCKFSFDAEHLRQDTRLFQRDEDLEELQVVQSPAIYDQDSLASIQLECIRHNENESKKGHYDADSEKEENELEAKGKNELKGKGRGKNVDPPEWQDSDREDDQMKTEKEECDRESHPTPSKKIEKEGDPVDQVVESLKSPEFYHSAEYFDDDNELQTAREEHARSLKESQEIKEEIGLNSTNQVAQRQRRCSSSSSTAASVRSLCSVSTRSESTRPDSARP